MQPFDFAHRHLRASCKTQVVLIIMMLLALMRLVVEMLLTLLISLESRLERHAGPESIAPALEEQRSSR